MLQKSARVKPRGRQGGGGWQWHRQLQAIIKLINITSRRKNNAMTDIRIDNDLARH